MTAPVPPPPARPADGKSSASCRFLPSDCLTEKKKNWTRMLRQIFIIFIFVPCLPLPFCTLQRPPDPSETEPASCEHRPALISPLPRKIPVTEGSPRISQGWGGSPAALQEAAGFVSSHGGVPVACTPLRLSSGASAVGGKPSPSRPSLLGEAHCQARSGDQHPLGLRPRILARGII